MHEQEILSEIQDLQQRLWRLQSGGTEDVPQEAYAEQKAKSKRRLIVVSNRLPLSIIRDADSGGLSYRMSSGGLVTALNGVKDDMSFLWVGWVGTEIAEDEQDMVLSKIKDDYNDSLRPVFIDDDLAELYYNGFSNDVLWPLFHYQPLPSFKQGDERKFNVQTWDAYLAANQKFAEVISQIYQPGDVIWVHDYHLMVLPSILRKRIPQCKIGWFLHVPFPSSEVYRMLPVRKEILEGVLSSDLVGFHTYDYARHFLTSCTRILGLECSPKGVEYNGRFCTIGVHPIGIDPEFFQSTLEKSKTQARIDELLEMFKGQKVLLGVDRLDYIKGMPHKLLAMELFLNKHPEWVQHVVLVQIAVPSRTEVDEYKLLCSQVNELVGRINGRFGSLDYTPIHYINRSVKKEELCALYNVADAAVVTSVRDGMNLVSYEYVVCQNEKKNGSKPGVLILSEFAGSAQSLSGALRINPWNTEDVANSFYEALTLGEVERELRHAKLYRYVTEHNASFWAKSFVQELIATTGRENQTDSLKVGPDKGKEKTLPIKNLLRAYKKAKTRLILTGYGGILLPSGSVGNIPSFQHIPNSIRTMLNELTKDTKNSLIVVSTRTKQSMQEAFAGLKCGIAAEHGFHYSMPATKTTTKNTRTWESLAPKEEKQEDDWKLVVLPIMSYFNERTPGSIIEQRELSLTWHYKNADQDFGAWQAKDLQVHLEDAVSDLPLEVYQGGKRLEVRHVKANKATFVEALLSELDKAGKQIDFVLCIGATRSDDDMFKVFSGIQQSSAHASQGSLASLDEKSTNELPALSADVKVFCCKVGREIRGGHASYRLDNMSQVKELLAILTDLSKKKR